MKFMKVFIVSMLGIVVLLSMCGDPQNSTQNNRNIFRYNEAAGITSLDPAFASNLENMWGVNMLFNGLVQMNDNLEVEPCIAKSWTISDDKKVYTFHLRNDVYFHDNQYFPDGKGRKVIAHDFLRSFLRLLDPNTASTGSYIFNNIDRNKENNWLGFKDIDDSTFVIYLQKPFPSFLGLLTMQYCSVIPEEITDSLGSDFRRMPVGTGPFMFTKWKEGVKLILEKNPNYFEKDESGSRLPYLDGVAVSFTRDRYIAFIEFLNKKFDFMSGLDHSYRNVILDNKGDLVASYKDKFRMEKHPWLKTDYLGFLLKSMDSDSLIMDDKNLRIAINYCIDRKGMVLHLRNNIGTPANAGFLPPGLAGYDKMQVAGYTYNVDKARDYLEKSYYVKKGSPVIVLETVQAYVELIESIANQLNEIGVNTEIDVVDASVYRVQVANAHLNFFRKSWLADYADPINFMQLFYSVDFCPDGPNYTHFKNAKFDELFEKVNQETTEIDRWELYRQMDSILISEAPIAPLYYDESIRFIQPYIKGLVNNSMNLLNLKKVKIVRKD